MKSLGADADPRRDPQLDPHAKRFDMPGFPPRTDWVREMKRYGGETGETGEKPATGTASVLDSGPVVAGRNRDRSAGKRKPGVETGTASITGCGRS